MENKRTQLDYKWVIVVISGLMVFTALGFCSSSNGMYVAPITSALNIARSAYSVTTSVRYVTTAIVNFFFGFLIYRFGAKKLIMLGFASLIASSLIYSFANNVPVFCVGSVFLGIGLSFTTTTMVGSVVNRWCSKSKGTIMGVILASNGVGAALARVILTPIILSDDYGFREAYRVVAIILLFVAITMLLFFRNNPKGEEGVRIEKKRVEKSAADRAVFKKVYFYFSLVCIFFTGLVLQSIVGIVDPHLADVGLDPAFITTALSFVSIFLSISKFGVGFIYDKTGIRITSSICYVASIIGFTSIYLVTREAQGLTYVYGVFISLALPLETIMLPIFARELFGENSFNSALGIFVAVNTAGYAIGGPIANAVFDMCQSYRPWLICAAIIMFVVIITMHVVITFAKRDQRAQAEPKLEAVNT